MRFGIFIPPFHEFSDPNVLMALATEAEAAGWDGFFLWDHILSEPGFALADTWVSLAAIATATERLRIGAMVTPLARRRPWVLARQITTLDLLSRGRLTIGVGLGDDGWQEFSAFGETIDPIARARQLDEGLELLRRFGTGQPVTFEGDEFHVQSPPFVPTPLQSPVPIWVAGRWPKRAPLVRAQRFDGFFPIFAGSDPPALPDIADLRTISSQLPNDRPPYDLIVRYAQSLSPDPIGDVAMLEAVGVTWILESFGAYGPDASIIRSVVRSGPQRAS